ncbi:hypothetical protein [Streptomyces avicenniae]|uniref:hypothetical protein n=1 Tax=Streptomyces avicenniae TaxID=500153 RepID=UPI0006992828|nr:hypothetical protein [Streptomyces avicenniae]
MSTLSGAEYRQMKREARDFARRARTGRTYYVVQTAGGHDPGKRVWEFRFTRVPLIGLCAGNGAAGPTPEEMWMRYGHVYDRRDHPDIRDLRTWREHREYDEKFEAQFLGSRRHHQAMNNAARGTGFRSTW